MADSYEEYLKELKSIGRQPTRQELRLLGRMLMHDKWFNFKKRVRGIFKRE